MPPSSPQALQFSLQVPPSGDLSHFSITGIVPAVKAAAPSGAVAVDRAPADNISGVIAKYQSLSGNLPNTYGNAVALWNSLLPNLSTSPLKTALVTTDDQIGEVFIDYGLSLTNYSVTYQLGSSTHTICAMAQIRQGSAAASLPMFVSIQIQSITTSTVSVLYSTLPGYQPSKYGNWIGMWPGFALPYDAPPPWKQAKVDSPYSQGRVTLDFENVTPDYTLVYFTGPELTHAAALLYFTVSAPQ